MVHEKRLTDEYIHKYSEQGLPSGTGRSMTSNISSSFFFFFFFSQLILSSLNALFKTGLKDQILDMFRDVSF